MRRTPLTARGTALFFCALFAITLALRLCHSRLLWADEDYHLAAGLQALHGKLLYHDVWYDKPPLAAWVYAAIGAPFGWPLRLFGAAYILAACVLAWRFATRLWGEREGLFAAGLLAFFLNFDFHFAVIPIAPDLFLLVPHLAAVYCAWRRKPFASGLLCGVAFLFQPKGVFVLAACAFLVWRTVPLLLLGFVVPNAVAFAVLALTGALPGYFQQVWVWGVAYVKDSPLPHPLANAFRRTADWMGFHCLLVLGAAWFWAKDRGDRTRNWIALWAVLSFAAVAMGARFWPRYYFQLLPPLVLVAARGWALLIDAPVLRRRTLALAAVAALVPLVRFGPRYLILARGETSWSDAVLDRDSRAAAALVNGRKHPQDTLMVWGYRPDVFVYTRLPVASRFWDSQPLTGVPADRHLWDARPIFPDWAARNRRELAASRPTFIVDGLSIANPALAISNYPELREWLHGYRVAARTSLSVVYQRVQP